MSYKTLLLIIVFLLIPIVFLLRLNQKPTTSLAEWWNDAWTYRQAINVSSHTVGETNVYITTTVNISSTTKAQADDGDFRFTDSSGQLLSYYIASGVGTTAPTFHLSLSSFPSGAQTLYAYYGNPSASNGFSSSDFSPEASNYSIGSLSTEETGGGPLAYWTFDEGVGTTVYDSGPNTYHGGFVSSPVWKSASECISGKCLYFNGSSRIDLPDNGKTDFTNQSFTVSAWIKLPSYYSAATTCKSSNVFGNDDWGWKLGINNSGVAAVSYYYDASNSIGVTAPTLVSLNQWHYLTSVLSAGTSQLSVYLDGKLEGQRSISTSTIYYNAADSPHIGAITGCGGQDVYFTGFIDDLKIYPYARTATQIKQDYATGLSGQSAAKGANANIGSASSGKSLTDGLVGYWKMDEGVGTTTADSSGKNNTAIFGTGASAPGWTTGKFGLGTSFDGNSDYLQMSTNSIVGSSAFTISAWVKQSSTTGTQGIISDWQTSGTFLLRATSGAVQGYVRDASATQFGGSFGTATLSTSTWTHVVMIYDGSVLKLYQDALLAPTTYTLSGNINAGSGSVGVGGRGGSEGYWNGQIDEVRVYNRALSQNEVQNLYDYAPSPVGYWQFDEGTGTTAYDTSGNNNPAVFAGGTAAPIWTLGKFGKGLSFDGSDSVSMGDVAALDITGKAVTLECWAKISSHNDYGGVCGKCEDTGANSAYCLYFSGATNNLSWFTRTTANAGSTSTTSVADNQWHYLVGTYDGSLATNQMKLYIDGQLESQTTQTDNLNNSADPFLVGRYNTAARFITGLVDEVKVYNYARTQKQIIQDMTAGAPAASRKSPLLFYKFDEGYGSSTANWGLGGTLNGTLGTGNSSPTWTTGKIGKGLSFDGTNDYVNFGNYSSFTNLSLKTISFWTKLVGQTGTDSLGSHFINKDNKWFVAADPANNRNIFGQNFSTTSGRWSFPLLSLNAWHHLIVVYDNGSTLNDPSIYVDGQPQVVTEYLTPVGSASDDSATGLYAGYSLGNGRWLNGLLDEVKIYSYPLTAAEVQADYNQGSSAVFGQSIQTIGATITSLDYCLPGDTSSCSVPVAEWKMDEGVGTTSADSSGNNNTGTWNGTGSHWTTGKIGTAGIFNGTDDYLSTGKPLSTFISASTGTISLWFKPSGTAGSGTSAYELPAVISDHTAGIGGGFIAISRGTIGGQDRIWFFNYGSGAEQRVGTTYTNNQWIHLTWIHSGGNIYAYANGQLVGSVASSNTDHIDTNLLIGNGWNLNKYLTGQIDQVRIYNYARTPAQVAYDYNRGGPLGWWKFDECQGTQIVDWSGFASHGTLTVGASGSQTSVGTCSVGTSAAWTNSATGKINSSLNFDGTDDYVSIGSTTFNSLHPVFSASAWIKTTNSTPTNQKAIVSKGTNGGDNEFDLSLETDGRIRFWYGTGNGDPAFSKTSIANNTWHHVIGVWDGTNQRVYLDGLSGTATSANSITTTTDPILIGSWNQAANWWFSGLIDDIRLYNYPLTSEQVKQLTNGGATSFR